MNGMEMAALASAIIALKGGDENRSTKTDLVPPPVHFGCLVRTSAAISGLALFLGVLSWAA